MVTGHNAADIVVVLKTLPTKEAVEALGNQVWASMKQKDPREVLTMIPNDRGFDLSSPEATANMHVTTIIPSKRPFINCIDKFTAYNREQNYTLFVKHYNDLPDRQSSEWDKDEVTFFYVGGVFLYTPWH